MNTATQDGPFDMYVEDLASLMTLDQNTFLSASTASWNSARHTDPKVDEYFARYAREMDPAKRKAIAQGVPGVHRPTSSTGTRSPGRPSTRWRSRG